MNTDQFQQIIGAIVQNNALILEAIKTNSNTKNVDNNQIIPSHTGFHDFETFDSKKRIIFSVH